MRLITPAALRVFTAILALSAVVILACAQDPAPSLHPSLYRVSRANGRAPHGVATADYCPDCAPNRVATANCQGDRQRSAGNARHEADHGFRSDYHAQ